ncbi:MAG: hypothetical protein MJE68_22135 [Proteobacteria bacterium]|nr:hypothetical protein [Pseudomonadota bacterium]
MMQISQREVEAREHSAGASPLSKQPRKVTGSKITTYSHLLDDWHFHTQGVVSPIPTVVRSVTGVTICDRA